MRTVVAVHGSPPGAPSKEKSWRGKRLRCFLLAGDTDLCWTAAPTALSPVSFHGVSRICHAGTGLVCLSREIRLETRLFRRRCQPGPFSRTAKPHSRSPPDVHFRTWATTHFSAARVKLSRSATATKLRWQLGDTHRPVEGEFLMRPT